MSNDNGNMTDKVLGFISQNRRIILMACALLLLLIIGVVSWLSYGYYQQQRSSDAFNKLQSLYEEVSATEDDTDLRNELDIFIDQILNERAGSPEAIRARWYRILQLRNEDKKQEALTDCLLLGEESGDNYLIPLALHTAASLADDLGEREQAESLLMRLLDEYGETSFGVLAFFRLGLIYENSGRLDEARVSYTTFILRSDQLDDSVEELEGGRLLTGNYTSYASLYKDIARSRLLNLDLNS